jgi:hypothetical protein
MTRTKYPMTNSSYHTTIARRELDSMLTLHPLYSIGFTTKKWKNVVMFALQMTKGMGTPALSLQKWAISCIFMRNQI